MIEFPLEEWEWPPGVQRHFAVEPFESVVRWPDGLKKTMLCAVMAGENSSLALVFFRPSEELAFNYVHLHEFANDEGEYPLLAFVSSAASNDGDDTNDFEEFDDGIEKYHNADFVLNPYRIFHLREQTAIIQRGVGTWCKELRGMARFRVPFENEKEIKPESAPCSGQTILSWLETQLCDENSEAFFATMWPSKSWDERFADYSRLSPQWRALWSLLQLVAQGEEALSTGFIWFLRLGEERSFLYQSSQRTAPPQSKRLEIWSQILRREFPLENLDASASPLCLLDSYRHTHQHALTVQGRKVTGHEQMEALCTLREWAQDKATPEEMEVLFPAG